MVLMLDVKRRAIGINTVAVGALSEAIVHPREVFKPAIIANAHSIIVGHNHPSGDPTPGREDEYVTRMLVEAGAILQIKVQDHIIVGEKTRFKSMAELGVVAGCYHHVLGDGMAHTQIQLVRINNISHKKKNESRKQRSISTSNNPKYG